MYFIFFLIATTLAPIAASAAECRPPENVRVFGATILDVEVRDPSKFPSHHADVYYSTTFKIGLPGCSGIPVVVREMEPIVQKCQKGQTINATGTYMEYFSNKTHIYVAVYPKDITCR